MRLAFMTARNSETGILLMGIYFMLLIGVLVFDRINYWLRNLSGRHRTPLHTGLAPVPPL